MILSTSDYRRSLLQSTLVRKHFLRNFQVNVSPLKQSLYLYIWQIRFQTEFWTQKFGLESFKFYVYFKIEESSSLQIWKCRSISTLYIKQSTLNNEVGVLYQLNPTLHQHCQSELCIALLDFQPHGECTKNGSARMVFQWEDLRIRENLRCIMKQTYVLMALSKDKVINTYVRCHNNSPVCHGRY